MKNTVQHKSSDESFTVDWSDNLSEVTIHTPPNFDFHYYTEFKRVYESITGKPHVVGVDFSDTPKLDSSVLGMLLLVAHHFGESVSIKLINCSEDAKHVLTYQKFDRLFQII